MLGRRPGVKFFALVQIDQKALRRLLASTHGQQLADMAPEPVEWRSGQQQTCPFRRFLLEGRARLQYQPEEGVSQRQHRRLARPEYDSRPAVAVAEAPDPLRG